MPRRVIGRIQGESFVPETESTPDDIERLVQMLASGVAPMMGNSDRAFLEGKHNNSGLSGNRASYTIEQAQKAGIQTNGRVYISQLADKRGPKDPTAWVSGLDDVRAACRKKGKGCESLGIPDSEPPPPKQKRLSEKLTREMMKKELQKDPSQAKNLRELREKVIEKHGSKRKSTVYESAE